MDAKNTDQTTCRSCGRDQGRLTSTDWQTRYDTGKTGWDRGEASPMLKQWLETGELRPCQILVPGCGHGHEVIALAEAGFDVTAVDFADSAVESLSDELKRRKLRANVVQSDVFSFCQARRFDAVYEQTCLCAIHPSQWQTYQHLLACWLRVGGNLFALFMQSDAPEGPPYSCPPNRMRELFSAPTWHWADESTRVEHPTGMHEIASQITRTESSK